MQGEQVAGDTTALEAFLEEAGCLEKDKPAKKKSIETAGSDESDFDVEEEFPSRRVAAAKARRGRGVAKATKVCGSQQANQSLWKSKVRRRWRRTVGRKPSLRKGRHG